MRYLHKIRPVLFAALCLGGISAACCAEELPDSSLDRLLEQIRTDYGVTLHYAEGPASRSRDLSYGLIDAENDRALKKAILLFAEEISLYPKNFFRFSGCRDIYFVQKLFFKEKPADGVFLEGTNTIFYDYSRRAENTQMIRHYFHHEIYHMIGSRHPFWRKNDAAWKALNRKGFSYGKKCDLRDRNPINYYAPPEPGFITDYAMASSEEDRAEVFACLMLPEQLSLLEQWSQKDGILSQKLEMMKRFLKESL